MIARSALPHGRGSRLFALLFLPFLLLGACGEPAPEPSPFPEPQRPVAPIVSSRYLNEDARDSIGEFEAVMRLAEIRPGMSIADIGAGEGYYTVRLSPMVGRDGRVLAEDIVPATIQELGERVQRERLDNVALKLGQANDPQLPDASFDRILMIHMYHEIARPSEFLWHLHDDLTRDGSVIVVDADRPTDRHGTPPRLLVCEFNAVGYELTRFDRLPDTETYFAAFKRHGPKPEPSEIRTCPA
ncbi:class I SAM-dependent methyltransferase [Sphingosinicella sp. CPCC 101087]|uniref:class I SAM-dependent methyltransferase n=1 Tax=Sphingosinicella sp. CPCC 101087 TaxID=2497754 RepID=UPI00101D0703|nr:methyltransferase domain-containing protein [Sphingosinicella sp. CPCC 101087]